MKFSEITPYIFPNGNEIGFLTNMNTYDEKSDFVKLHEETILENEISLDAKVDDFEPIVMALDPNVVIDRSSESINSNRFFLLDGHHRWKFAKNKNFIIMDAAMNDLLRPALYGSAHNIIPSIKKFQYLSKNHEFVGPICESTDKFLNLKKFQTLNEKDLIIICDVGAYGMVLSSNYNLRTKPAEILVNKSLIKIISKRQKLNNII